jgi:hypothetical protein
VPSSSKKQADFMRAVAHSPEFAKKTGVPQSVGEEFSNADKGRKFSKGGDMATKMNPAFKAMIEKKKAGAKPAAKKMNMGGMGYAKGGVTRADGCVTKGHTKGTMVKMAMGGKAC